MLSTFVSELNVKSPFNIRTGSFIDVSELNLYSLSRKILYQNGKFCRRFVSELTLCSLQFPPTTNRLLGRLYVRTVSFIDVLYQNLLWNHFLGRSYNYQHGKLYRRCVSELTLNHILGRYIRTGSFTDFLYRKIVYRKFYQLFVSELEITF